MDEENIPTCNQPPDFNISVWRYMDFTKFVSMLTRRGLFFSRLDRLGDPFEGSFPKLNTQDEYQPVDPSILDPEGFIRSMKGLRQCIKFMRQWVYVNCWCWYMSEYESAAMWSLYTRTNEAICIRSTFIDLQKQLPKNASLQCVDYIDYNNETLPKRNEIWPFSQKRKSFEHENEVRAMIFDQSKGLLSWSSKIGTVPKSVIPPEPPESGIWVDVNLTELIDEVYVAPASPKWFKETVEQTIQKFDFKFPVVQSSLDDSPVW